MAVYRDLDQAALDAQLNPRAATPALIHHVQRWHAAAEAARAAHDCRRDLAYGADAAERLDLFGVAGPVAPLVVFFHGGDWQALDKADFAFLAPPFLAHGIAVALVGYGGVPATPLAELVERGRRAVVWLHRNAVELDLDPTRIHLAGHGAGAHIALAAVSASWRPYELLGRPAVGVIGLGGLYDLEPVRLSYLNAALGLDRDESFRLSPLHRPPPDCAAVVATGGRESLEYRRQARALEAAWRRQGGAVETIELPGEDHFSLLDRFAAPEGALFRAVLLRLRGA
ncbi:MAG: alpha/beta hydrolase [Alphaproteobacteria bacterium]|nr:alpha/beta hydrolase [Alphaproteobacteria bacterium]